MAQSREANTYLNGQKVELPKRPDQFVVRILPDAVEKARRGVRKHDGGKQRKNRVIGITAGSIDARNVAIALFFELRSIPSTISDKPSIMLRKRKASA